MHIVKFKMDKQQEHTLKHMELCSMLCGSQDGMGVWGQMDIRIYVAESTYFHCSPENMITLLISYTPI